MGEKLKELGVSLVRTKLAPLIGALLVRLALKYVPGLHIEKNDSLINGLTYILTIVWYALFRAIEVLANKYHVQKWAGRLLGVSRVNNPL
jgi:hypothetical protein